jgi:hypothetical protein
MLALMSDEIKTFKIAEKNLKIIEIKNLYFILFS